MSLFAQPVRDIGPGGCVVFDDEYFHGRPLRAEPTDKAAALGLSITER
jgi:hypothetical protein